MTKAMDLLMWNLEVSDRDKVLPVIFELAEKVESEHGIRVRPMRRRQLRKDMDAFAEVYNSAWSKNWDFVPYSKKDLDAYAQELQLVFDKHWFMIAEREDTGEVVGMAITVPDLNQVLAQMKGRLLPLGWWHFLNKGRLTDRVRVGFLGVKPEYQHTGVAAQALRRALQRRRSAPAGRRRDGLDPRDQHGDEPRHGSDGRARRQALPDLREISVVPCVRSSKPLCFLLSERLACGRAVRGTGARIADACYPNAHRPQLRCLCSAAHDRTCLSIGLGLTNWLD